MTKVRTMPAMGTITVSERLRTILKMPLFHAEGVMPTSPAISPTLVFRVSNIPVRFEMIPSMSSSWNHSCIASKINGDHLLLQYIWTGKPGSQSGFPSISCLSYNERSNWLTIASLGFYVRRKDCQSSSCCSVRFEQVEPPDAGEFASHNRLNRQREKMDSGCRFLVLEECK